MIEYHSVGLTQPTVGQTLTETVPYNSGPTPYRFVRLNANLVNAYQVDAIEATMYRPDSDGDGLSDGDEINISIDPMDDDTDNDGLPDGWEYDNGLDPLDGTSANGDPDNDGLNNGGEFDHGSDPHNWDTDNDGLPDGWEVEHGFDPLDPNNPIACLYADGHQITL